MNGSATSPAGKGSSPARMPSTNSPSLKFSAKKLARTTVTSAPDSRNAASAASACGSRWPDSSTSRRTPCATASRPNSRSAGAAVGAARSGTYATYARSTPRSAGPHVEASAQSKRTSPSRDALRVPARTVRPRAASRSATRRPVLPVAAVTRTVSCFVFSVMAPDWLLLPGRSMFRRLVRMSVRPRPGALTLDAMDALTGLLNGPRAQGAFILRMVMQAPWSVRIEDRAPLCLMLVRRGEAWIEPEDGPPVRLTPGDAAIARGPAPYTVCDRPGTPPRVTVDADGQCTGPAGEPLGSVMQLGVRTWGDRADGDTALLVGTYRMEGEIGGRLLQALPPLLTVPRGSATARSGRCSTRRSPRSGRARRSCSTGSST